jgi:uncharacterized protein (TIGR02679 family)
VVNLPASLLDDGLAPLLAQVRERLERNGPDWRGRVAVPELPRPARVTLETLTGRRSPRTVSLVDLEQGLVRAGAGGDLLEALTRLGHPVSAERTRRRAERRDASRARSAARDRAAGWPEPWAPAWIDEVIAAGLLAGLEERDALRLVDEVRVVLDALESPGASEEPDATGAAGTGAGPGTRSRVELAARHLGSAHALDRGTRLERAATRALSRRLVDAGAERDDDLWARAGAHTDLLSGAALTWNLPLAADHALAPQAHAATDLGLPFVVTQLALRAYPLRAPAGADVLVVENPRVLERAVQDRVALGVVCGNGNPSTTVRLLIAQLLEAGASLRYHGDFDAAGLAICARLHGLGVSPWRMTEQAYLEALSQAEDAGVELPVDPSPAGPTPWAPALRAVFDERRRIVHEERLLDTILLPRPVG